MDSVSYRKWELWKNETLLEENASFNGYFECVFTPTLMVHQTVEFLCEHFDFHLDSSHNLNAISIQRPPREIINQIIINGNNELCLRIYNRCENSQFTAETIYNILRVLNQLSLKIDIALNCNKITFFDHNKGKVFQAMRRSIGRGMSFEVEERGFALKNIITSNPITPSVTPPEVKGYLTGLNLLGLEDQFPGLIEAAFMQFYIACEAACETNSCDNAKKYIRDLFDNEEDSRRMQIIAFHVWSVRNEYFGHLTANKNRLATNYEQAARIAKQVLIARYLCKKIIQKKYSEQEELIREIGFYTEGYAQTFTGEIAQLESEFWIEYRNKSTKIYPKTKGEQSETYKMPDMPAVR